MGFFLSVEKAGINTQVRDLIIAVSFWDTTEPKHYA